ncbi:hypothetical protein ABTY53_06335 [Streptomyces noursei]|uniref:MmyB family transcriptional regulator n=1 Tax=Streptomyces noursei TaxID=1971 RepID=UPI00331EB0F5
MDPGRRREEFAALWNDQTVGGLTRACKVFVHPRFGRVELTYQTFDVRVHGARAQGRPGDCRPPG